MALPNGLVARTSGEGVVGAIGSDDAAPVGALETEARWAGVNADSRGGGTLAFAVASFPPARAGGLEFATGRANGFARSVFPGSHRSHHNIARPTITRGPQNRTGSFRRLAGLYLV